MSSEILGAVEWRDLTVDDAESIRDFYAAVVGWEPGAVSMGDYDDFNMLPPGSTEPAAGICHARGMNSGLPPQWVMYVRVADIDVSLAACEAAGGRSLLAPVSMGDSRYCVIQDPAGAVLGLISA